MEREKNQAHMTPSESLKSAMSAANSTCGLFSHKKINYVGIHLCLCAGTCFVVVGCLEVFWGRVCFLGLFVLFHFA